jgi:hypothetical protein
MKRFYANLAQGKMWAGKDVKCERGSLEMLSPTTVHRSTWLETALGGSRSARHPQRRIVEKAGIRNFTELDH